MMRRTAIRGTLTLTCVMSGLLQLGACASPSTRISTSLVRYGLDEPQARCVGDSLQANLSLGQLQQLGRAAGALKEGDTTPGRLTIDDLLRVSARIDDPKVPLEVAKAAAGCGLATRLIR